MLDFTRKSPVSKEAETELLEVGNKVINDPLHGLIIICLIGLSIIVLGAGFFIFIKLRQYAKNMNGHSVTKEDIDIIHRLIDKNQEEMSQQMQSVTKNLYNLNTQVSYLCGKLNGKIKS